MRTGSHSFLAAVVAACTLPLYAAQFHSNAVKYRDSSKPNATGRSGSAVITARALVNPDGSADLQLTTGSFDPATSRGNIDKVQIKSESTGTINDNRLTNGGTYSVNLPSVGRGQSLSVLALVSGIDGRRTDVVGVSETAKLRPDLYVVSVSAPESVLVGAPAVITGVVAEINGDVGARADCTLRVDGQLVGAASRIWVDAGGTVSCSFLHTFQRAGAATVEVAATGVDPGDWDAANNSYRTSVNVTENELDMVRWYASSSESEHRTRSAAEASWGYRTEYNSEGWRNSTYFHAIWSENLDLATLRLRYLEKTDGVTLVDLPTVPLVRNDRAWRGRGRGQCMVGLTPQISVVICQRGEVEEFGFVRPKFINPIIDRRAGDVTYFFGEWGYTSPDGAYVHNEHSGRQVYGNQTRLGSAMSLEVVVADATRTYAERPSYALQYTRTQDASQPWHCYNSYWCREWSFYQFDRWGFESSPGY